MKPRTRCSGILLHPTSLPSPHGIGDLGENAYRFVDFLAETGQTLWQVLPLGPTGFGDSPYQSFSAFAGNPLVICLDQLKEEGWLHETDFDGAPAFSAYKADYGSVIEFKFAMLNRAYQRFRQVYQKHGHEEFDRFSGENAWWLDDYALFYALKEEHGGRVWNQWDHPIALRQPQAVQEWRSRLAQPMQAVRFWQYLFFKQWQALKQYANDNNIRIIGDIPIYVAYDSADVWSHPELYYLDETGSPTVVAGVPPDYFSETGQLWGNPIYRWDVMARSGFRWWVDRLQQTFMLVDIVRLDHFRGFEAYWEVPAGDETAENGRWVEGPGEAFFETMREAIGGLPIIAENLGLITEEVEELRRKFDLPGMAVLQFAFDPNTMNSDYLPHNYARNLVAYTGTHDNDTTVGWWDLSQAESTVDIDYARREREFANQYMDADGRPINWTCIRTVMRSVADTVIFPLQDVLGLGNAARMNKPGSSMGNWTWRFTLDQLALPMREQLNRLTRIYNRCDPPEEDDLFK